MADAKISFRIDAEQKSRWVQEAKGFQLTLTEYLIWLIDYKNQHYPSSETKKIVGKSDAEISEILKDSESKFRAEFQKEISNAYQKGYQHGRNEVIRK
jgi:flagellar biosynthesis/type III secretory pathway protein FliH